ncbi:GNAT family N-acetyltransferase [Bremerella sp. JC817]|uniref:GNAT family N-acetyltransferase n=1 Tax=Bremerella sp. JC817 TaxID=3231756 RepID=UPI003458F692
MTIRNTTQAEAFELVEWAAGEGWNPGLHDAESFWRTDPEGFMAIEVDGQMAGAGGAFYHGPSYGFMGLFIMKPEFRGQGLGRQLWYARRDRLQSRLESGGTIGMDAVTSMIPFYHKGGFEIFTRHCRFSVDAESISAGETPDVVELSAADWDAVAKLDQYGFPGPRDAYLKAWTSQPGVHWLGVHQQGELKGYCVLRACRSGWKIGPLFAADGNVARQLMHASLARAKTGPVFLDAPENNPDAWAMCQEFGMQQVFECTRMYLGPVPALDHGWIYGVTSLEAG